MVFSSIHLSLFFNQLKKKHPCLPYWWKFHLPAFIAKQKKHRFKPWNVGWNCCASRGGGCSPCLFGGGPEWKEMEKAPPNWLKDRNSGRFENLISHQKIVQMFDGEKKTCEMKFTWLAARKYQLLRFQIQSQNSTFKNPTTKPTKTHKKHDFCHKKMISPFCWILHDMQCPGYWDLTPWALLSTTSSGTFRKTAPTLSVPRLQLVGLKQTYKKKNPGNKIAGGFLLVECLSFFVNFCAGQVLDRQSLEVLSLPITDTGWWQLKCFWNFHPEPWGNDPICGLKPPPREGVIFDMWALMSWKHNHVFQETDSYKAGFQPQKCWRSGLKHNKKWQFGKGFSISFVFRQCT